MAVQIPPPQTPQPAPVLSPTPVRHFGMWVTFEYILLFISLYVSFTALGGILNFAVDKYFPNPKDSIGTVVNAVQTAFLPGYLAAIFVTYPIFAFLYYHLNKQLLANPEIKNLRSRKILIYFTLIVTFILLISRLIATVYGFFQGTTTTNAFMHMLVTFLVAGSVFGYLIADVRGDRHNV